MAAMPNFAAESVRAQSRQIFQNVDAIFQSLGPDDWNASHGGFPVWQHMYHLLHSLDQYCFDPRLFKEPPFHHPGLNTLGVVAEHTLSAELLEAYWVQVKDRVTTWLDSLDDIVLAERLEWKGQEHSRLELVLAQYRHLYYHVGYLHCAIKLAHGQTPPWFGLARR